MVDRSPNVPITGASVTVTTGTAHLSHPTATVLALDFNST